jgi:Uma2 family endonuclease
MSTALPPPPAMSKALPTHLDLPDTDGLPVLNTAEPTQTRLLTESIRPVLHQVHPDGRFFVGQDCGVYWRITDPPLAGCKSPDWYYVPNVDPTPPDFPYRRSYVLWHEHAHPLIIVEYVSDDSGTEWDQTPNTGKFWVYEQQFRPTYYAIHTHATGELEVYERVEGRFVRMAANARGHFPMPPLPVELGTVRAKIDGLNLDWLRWFDDRGALLLYDEERYDQERLKRERAEQQARESASVAKQAEDRARRLADKLRELGIDPTQV